MRFNLIIIIVVAGMLGLQSAEPVVPLTLDRAVTLELTVSDAVGKPIEGMLLSVKDEAASDYAITNADGLAIIETRIAEDASTITIAPFGIRWASGLPADARKRIYHRMRALRESVFIPRDICIHVGEKSRIARYISLKDSQSISGRVVGANGEPSRAIIQTEGLAFTISNAQGMFSLDGLAEATEQFIYVIQNSQITRRKLSVAQTSERTKIGDITFPEVSQPVRISVQLNGIKAFATTTGVTMGVTFIGADGTIAFSPIKMAGSADIPVVLPAGEYYIVPGNFDHASWQVRAWDYAAAQQPAAPEDRGPLRITFNKDTDQPVTIDLMEAYERIMEILPEGQGE